MRVRNKEGCATSGFKGPGEIVLGFGKAEVTVKAYRGHVSKRFAVPGIPFKDLLETRSRFVILLSINKIENAGEVGRARWGLKDSRLICSRSG